MVSRVENFLKLQQLLSLQAVALFSSICVAARGFVSRTGARVRGTFFQVLASGICDKGKVSMSSMNLFEVTCGSTAILVRYASHSSATAEFLGEGAGFNSMLKAAAAAYMENILFIVSNSLFGSRNSRNHPFVRVEKDDGTNIFLLHALSPERGYHSLEEWELQSNEILNPQILSENLFQCLVLAAPSRLISHRHSQRLECDNRVIPSPLGVENLHAGHECQRLDASRDNQQILGPREQGLAPLQDY
nr:Os07g0584283 [Ipomoea batatas]